MNTKPILIVESPSKAKTISKFLSDQYDVIACVGHVKDLPPKKLGVDVDNDFDITLSVLPDKKAFIKQLKGLAKTAPKIVLATDPDREGEAIASHLASEIKGSAVERVQFTEITAEGIQEGMNQSRTLDINLVEAQKTRRIIDRLVGYKISPILWATLQKTMRFVKTHLSAGRVQSAAVKVVVDRERERSDFRESIYFDLEAMLLAENGTPFKAVLSKLDGKQLATGKDFDKNTGALSNAKARILLKPEADSLLTDLKPGPWNVLSVDESPKVSRPKPPFTTSTLQQEASRKLRFSARQTMRTAQNLYEAGLITYMRTDSTSLSNEGLTASRNEIKNQFGADYLPDKPVHYATKVKNAQEAHEAIRPAGGQFKSVASVGQKLDLDAQRLYELIWKRTIASQMKPARFMQTTVIIENHTSHFRANGRTIVFPGFMKVYIEGSDDPDADNSANESILPPIQKGQDLGCQNLKSVEHRTKPPARFTEASLVKELEARGIGRPSTYASILDTIQRRDYVISQKSSLVPTYLAIAVTQLLENHFETLVNSEFTAKMEDNLDSISKGDLEALPFMKDFYFGSDDQLGLSQMIEKKIDIRKACTIEIKMDDAEPAIIRIGNFGPYLSLEEGNASIPQSLPLGDINPEKVEELKKGGGKKEDVILGKDELSGTDILLKEGPYGPYVQLGDSKTRKSLPQGVTVDTINVELASRLLALPRPIGIEPESGDPILADFGRYGPYLKVGKKNVKLNPPLSPLTVSLEEALEAIKSGGNKGPVSLKTLGKHPESEADIEIKSGRYGPYITDGKINASLTKGFDPETITLEEAVELLKKKASQPRKKRRRKR